MKNVSHSQNSEKRLMRRVRPAELVNRHAVNAYIELFGTPVCHCCGFITLLPVFQFRSALWRVYCVNCGITLQSVGHCFHAEDEDMARRMINPKENVQKIVDSSE
jgi:hypothetical protein